ncbi:uncharacterized protein KGF55_002020 [Candida pseudojiufengensis]|uniref:uncharacterized protein n=1 Tax=Candida pseudojiufengensis TaxID=497109 RepID=UPI0022248566|nr:uncharacterized protein KGF55_002020 [Candida pseudojiufengensis]KAI5964078.1 hypothetical protein KGF55_002020 [Candida pseudojiufengensis]
MINIPKDGNENLENPLINNSSTTEYRDENENDENQEESNFEFSQSIFKSTITGISTKGKLYYSISMGIILLILSLIFIKIGGLNILIGYFLLPFGIYLLFILSGLIVFGYENQIGSDVFFKLIVKHIRIVGAISIVLSLILYLTSGKKGHNK